MRGDSGSLAKASVGDASKARGFIRAGKLPKFSRVVRNTLHSLACVWVLVCSPLLSHANDTKAAVPAIARDARTCVPCHSAAVRGIAETPHGHAVVSVEAKELTCATCHGSQKAHMESGGSTAGMIDPASGNAGQVDAMCLACHAGKHANFARSAHGKSSISCTSCHSIHSAAAPRYLLKAAQSELCYKCHAQVKPQFSMASRHNVNVGLIQCTDCHDPHGTHQDAVPGTAHRQDAFCADCHTATAGPFAFEHAVIKTEGCTACHFAHGGPNPHLLLRANVDTICQTCHFPPPDPKTGAHIQPAKDHPQPPKSCTECHIDIHGSNSSPTFRRNQ